MKKSTGIGLALLFCAAGGLFGQHSQDANSRTHWASFELGTFHGGARYEYMLTDNFSVGASGFGNSFFLAYVTAGYEVFGRWYPWGGAFYAELGVGYGETAVAHDGGANRGLLLDPGIGWKADVGVPGKFFLNPVLQIPYVLGTGLNGNEPFHAIPSFRFVLGLGYAF